MSSVPSVPPAPTIPTVHLNGTSGTTLVEEYQGAYEAIDRAIDALAATTCNGRDFYPQGPDAYHQAREERQQALQKLREAQEYVELIWAGISDQMHEREQARRAGR